MKQSTIMAFISLFLLAGCSTGKINDYQATSPAPSERAAQQSGVEVALDPFVESSRTQQYFDINAVADGIAILHVRVSNKTAGQTFLVEKKHFRLVPNEAVARLAADGNKIERSNAAGEALSIAGAGGVLGLAGLGMTSHSSEIQRNCVSKEMADQTLSPGQSMEGFIYFSPVKKGQDWSRTTTVEVSLADTKTHQVTELSIPLSH
jgi:hypothetical protein